METGQYRLRKAAAEEVPAIWEIILQAKAQMYREGKHQWDENYPTVPILENDVRRVFSRLGFTYCGRIRYEAGERMAYEKLL